jgi:colanic acid/amylovoran biosynthesis protein
MTKVLLIGASLTKNVGGPCLAASTCKILRAHIPDAEFTLLSYTGERDLDQGREYGLTVVGVDSPWIPFLRCLAWAMLSKLKLNIPALLDNQLLREYSRADIFVDIWGISFSDLSGGWLGNIMSGMPLLIGKLLKKPVVKFTQDMGPFNRKGAKYTAKFFLSKVDLIMARGETSKGYLQDLGVSKQIYVRPDSAFVLDPCPEERIDNILLQEKLDRRPLVGVTVTTQIDRRLSGEDRGADNRYTITLAQIVDYLIDRLNALIVFIPNETEGGYDDVYVARKVYKNIRNKGSVRLVTNEYRAEELKGLIGKCDLLIGSRYHSIVAALSMCVPCLVIGWGHKYDELMGIVGQTEFVCDFQAVSFDEARAKVDRLWRMREEIRGELASRVPSIKERVLSSGKLVRDLLRTSNLT